VATVGLRSSSSVPVSEVNSNLRDGTEELRPAKSLTVTNESLDSTPELKYSKKYYVVTRGLEIGIFTKWSECLKHTNKVSGNCLESYNTREDAKVEWEEAKRAGRAERIDKDGNPLPLEG